MEEIAIANAVAEGRLVREAARVESGQTFRVAGTSLWLIEDANCGGEWRLLDCNGCVVSSGDLERFAYLFTEEGKDELRGFAATRRTCSADVVAAALGIDTVSVGGAGEHVLFYADTLFASPVEGAATRSRTATARTWPTRSRRLIESRTRSSDTWSGASGVQGLWRPPQRVARRAEGRQRILNEGGTTLR